MPMPAAQPLSDAEYHREAEALLASIEAAVDHWLQHDVIDIDVQRTGGLLELTLPAGGKIVVNTQPPLHEVWLAARTGGYHFHRVGGRWIDTKTGDEFCEVLSREASLQSGQPLRFSHR